MSSSPNCKCLEDRNCLSSQPWSLNQNNCLIKLIKCSLLLSICIYYLLYHSLRNEHSLPFMLLNIHQYDHRVVRKLPSPPHTYLSQSHTSGVLSFSEWLWFPWGQWLCLVSLCHSVQELICFVTEPKVLIKWTSKCNVALRKNVTENVCLIEHIFEEVFKSNLIAFLPFHTSVSS